MWYQLNFGGNFTDWSLYIFSSYRAYECIKIKYWLDNAQYQFTLHILCIFATLHYQTWHPQINNYQTINHLHVFIIKYSSLLIHHQQSSNNYHHNETTSFHKHKWHNRRNHPHHDNQYFIHPLIIDSFIFHHTIMNIKSFASYQIIIQHFIKCRLISPKSVLFCNIVYFQISHQNKTSYSYISTNHSYISPIITIVQA